MSPNGNTTTPMSIDHASPPARSRSASPGAKANAATQLGEAIDEFLADVEKKFNGMNEEILNKLDDMAERCDKLEAELLLTESEGLKTSSGSAENSS